VVNGKDHFFHSLEEYNEALPPEEGEENGNGSGSARSAAGPRGAELHEVRDIEKLIAKLKTRGVSIEDYLVMRQEAVTGDKDPARVKELFFQELGVAQNTVASNLRIVVRPTPFVRFRKSYIVHPHPTFIGPVEMGRDRQYTVDLPVLDRTEGIKVLFDLQHIPREPGPYSSAEVSLLYDVPSLNLKDQELVGNI
jgi:hypothetical protein